MDDHSDPRATPVVQSRRLPRNTSDLQSTGSILSAGDGYGLLHPTDSDLQGMTEVYLDSESRLFWRNEVSELSTALVAEIETMKTDEGARSLLPAVQGYVRSVGTYDTVFALTEFDEQFTNFKIYNREPYQAIQLFMPEASPFSKVESDFLRLGFCAAYASLKDYIYRHRCLSAAQQSTYLTDSLMGWAEIIAAEEKDKFDRNQLDPAMMHEKMECLYRIRIALENPLNKENNIALGLLAERSGSKSYWWFFLGVVVLVVSVVLMLATHGVAIPYLAALAKLSIAQELSTLSLLGCAGGIGIMWWQQQPNASKLCCFWHMKNQHEGKDSKHEVGRSHVHAAPHS